MRAFEKIRLVYILIFLALFFSLTEKIDANENENKQKKEIEETLNYIFKQRAGIMINQNIHELETHYLMNQQLSSNAYRNEKNRINYVNEWAKKRSIRLVDANSDIRLVRLNISENKAIVSLVQSFKLSYDYLNKIVPIQTFGVGTRHFITLKKIDGKWIIHKEWYLDPLDENPNKIAETPNGIAPSAKTNPEIYKGKKYNRSQAISYANKYAGAALGVGNNHRYNKKYLDYTGQGGDCTNFSSQVIGDVEAGGLPMTGAWRYIKGAGGSQSWIRTDSFSNYILRSGYGELVSKGDLRHIVTPTRKHPDGAISHIQPGDLIGYIIDNNDVDHFSIVVDFDKYGYPLVNSHTADRYRVPFDLGWDKNTKYVLIHIKD